MMMCLWPVQSRAGGHAAGEATDAHLPEVGNAGQVGSHHCQWVWWVYEETILTKDHTAILHTYRGTTTYFFILLLEVQKDQFRRSLILQLSEKNTYTYNKRRMQGKLL